ncbi:MAG: hypothetical protein Q9162_004144 [Coniocarpon cinnabarinum]
MANAQFSEAPTADTAAAERPITIEVGERSFKTLPSTLTGESPYFASKLSGRWTSGGSDDQRLFIDADPDMFRHVLRYLQHGTFPLFWDSEKGFDYGRYAMLLQEARYFGIDALRKWIHEKKFLNAVTIHHTSDVFEGTPTGIARLPPGEQVSGNVKKTFHPGWGTKLRYRCPRDILQHHGDPSRCGRVCDKAKSDDIPLYEKVPVLHVFTATSETVVNFDACMVRY